MKNLKPTKIAINALRLIILLKITLLTIPANAQGKLSRTRQAVRNEKPKEDAKPQQQARAQQPAQAHAQTHRPKSPPKAAQQNHRSVASRTNQQDQTSKLNQVRNVVRPKPNNPTPPRPNNNTGNHHHDHDHRRRPRNRGYFGFYSTPCPPQIIHTREVHVIEPAILPPATVVAPVIAQPQLEPIITSEPVQPPVYQRTIHEPVPVIENELPTFTYNPFETWSARTSIWYGAGVDNISQANFGLLLQSPNSLGLDFQIRTLRERGFSDHLWLGDLNLVYEPILTHNFRLRVGAGFNWLSDSFGSDFGFNLTSGFDAQIAPRWIMAGEVDLGNLGSGDYTHAQLSLGYQLSNSELLFGYDYTNIGGVDLESPFVGLRFRF